MADVNSFRTTNPWAGANRQPNPPSAGSWKTLQGTASVAAILITTEAMVAERPEKRAAILGNGGVGDMDF
jgi:hypothetical protein